MQTVREFTWDPGGHDKQLKELKPEWFSFKQEICLWISKILTNLSNKISEEDDEPRKSKTHNLADETPDNIKIRLRLLWHWVLKHATKTIFSKSFSKHTQLGAFTTTLNNKLNKNYTLVVFIAFTDRIGLLNPTSKKESKNNKVDIGDFVYIPQVRVQTPTWKTAMHVDGDGSGPPHHPLGTIKTKHSRRLLGVTYFTMNDSTAYRQSLQSYDYTLWSLTLKKALSVDGDGFVLPHHPHDTNKERHGKVLGVTHFTLNGTAKRLGLHFYDHLFWSASGSENGKNVDDDNPGPPSNPSGTIYSK